MNYLDLGILALVALCGLAGYLQGLIRTVYRLVSFFAAMVLTYIFYPPVARIIRDTAFYDTIQDSIKNALNLGGFVTEHAAERQTDIINSLPIPVQFRQLLENNFDPDIHGILGVDTIEEYISGFFANIAINGIAMILVFFVIMIGLTIAGSLLDIVGKLPVIRTFNDFGGLIFGVIMGAGIAWLVVTALFMFFATAANAELLELLKDSFIARMVIEHMTPRLSAVK